VEFDEGFVKNIWRETPSKLFFDEWIWRVWARESSEWSVGPNLCFDDNINKGWLNNDEDNDNANKLAYN
jgi:hypothetical protein